MPFRVHIVRETDPRLLMRLDAIYSVLEHLQGQVAAVLSNQERQMATIKQLVDDVAAVRGAADSIGTLITQLREQIAGLIAGNLPPDVQAQVDQAFADAEAAKTELAAAVANPGTAATSAPAGATAPSSGTPVAPSSGT